MRLLLAINVKQCRHYRPSHFPVVVPSHTRLEPLNFHPSIRFDDNFFLLFPFWEGFILTQLDQNDQHLRGRILIAGPPCRLEIMLLSTYLRHMQPACVPPPACPFKGESARFEWAIMLSGLNGASGGDFVAMRLTYGEKIINLF